MVSFLLKRAVLVLATLLAALPASAQSPRWQPIGPYGGTIATLVVDPLHPKTLYAAGDFPAVVKSTDGGASWRVLPGSPDGGVVALDPAHPATLFAAYRASGLARSVDGGAHWQSLGGRLPLLHVKALAVDPARPSRVYLGSQGGGMWRSDNGGLSWHAASQGLVAGERSSITALLPLRQPAGTALAGTFSAALFRTANGGASWTAVSGLPTSKVLALAAAPSDPRTLYVSLPAGVFRSADGGVTWTSAGRPAPFSTPIVALAVDPRAPATVYAGGQRSGLYKTTDAGAHWDLLEGFPSVGANALVLDPTRPAVLYAGTTAAATDPGGVLRSPDGGETWTARSLGIPGLDTLAVSADPRAPAHLAAGTHGAGLFVRGAGSSLWIRSTLGFTLPPNPESGVIVPQLHFTPPGTPGALYAVLWPFALERSKNGGLDFNPVFTPQYPNVILALRQDAALPFRLFWLSAQSGGAETALWTALPAAIWYPLSDPCPGCPYHDLAVAHAPGAATATLYLGGGDRYAGSTLLLQTPRDPLLPIFFRSDDGGATWLDLADGLPHIFGVRTIAVDPGDPRTVYAGLTAGQDGAVGGIRKSADGGETWDPTGPQIPNQTVVALLASPRPGRVYAAIADGRVFRSDDGGAEWSLWTTGLAVRAVHAFALDPGDPRHLYAATSGGVWEIADEP
jgi:photosystem II stability/assembly factor-like uncharacterized protein